MKVKWLGLLAVVVMAVATEVLPGVLVALNSARLLNASHQPK